MTEHANNAPVAIVTGGARRLGRACSIQLAGMGFDVAVVFNRSAEEAAGLAEELRKAGGRATTLKCDLRDPAACESVVADCAAKLGAPTVLVNNASIFEKATLLDTSTEKFDANFAVHVRAPFILTREFAKIAETGVVVNMLDTRVIRHSTTYFAYLLSKKALFEMTRLSASELAPGIRVNAIAPGFILPAEGSTISASSSRLVDKNPMRTKGEPADITAALKFLVENDFVTGETIFVDGGENLLS